MIAMQAQESHANSEPCPIYPEGCHDPQHCALGSPCVQADDELLDSIGTRQASREGTGNVMDEQEQVEQILIVWKMALAIDGPTPSRRAAELAVRAMNRPREWIAGDTIPDDVHAVEGVAGLIWVNNQDGTWSTGSTITTDELTSILGPVREITITEDWEPGDWERAGAAVLDDDYQGQASVDAPARLAASVIPVLEEVRATAGRVGRMYRDGKRMTARMCREAESSVELCDAAIETLTGLVEGSLS